jgi:hypothetical protein
MEAIMKKITAILIAIFMLANMMAVVASANALPTDITNQIQWVTAFEIYEKKLPIVRADAVFMNAMDYTAATAPGSGIRMCTITDWAERGLEEYFDDYFHDGDGFFFYDAVWANSTKEPYDHGLMTYNFSVEEAGIYEIVFVGCAQIKAENVDLNEKDRGFAFSIDNGDIQQVNISDTLGIFREYKYEVDKATYEANILPTTNGVNHQLFLPTYYYGIQLNLTAGSHTLEFYHLFSSGDFVFESGNGPRLNYFGAYVQKYLTDDQLAAYVYPELTTEEVTTAAPEPETTAAPETQAPETQAPETQAPETQAPATQAPTTEAPKAEGGCGAMVGFGTVLAIIPVAALVIKKKRD